MPVLGICYGAQLIARQLGGEVDRTGRGEYGRTALTVTSDGPAPSVLFGAVPAGVRRVDEPFRRHRAGAARISGHGRPPPTSPVAALEDPARGIYGVQFHPEVAHTHGGQEILKAFLYDVCGCRPAWTMTSVIEASVDGHPGPGRRRAGHLRAVRRGRLGGGRRPGPQGGRRSQLTCVFVDTGLLRAGRGRAGRGHVPASSSTSTWCTSRRPTGSSGALDDVVDPERKRKIIGETFIRVFEEAAADLGDARFLVQGTLYPDIIESGTKDAARIKSHHNVGGLPDDMQFELVEPLRNLFKDEVRAVGEELGPARGDRVAPALPRPGPGRAHRRARSPPSGSRILQAADAIVTEEIRRAGLYRELWQSFAVLPGRAHRRGHGRRADLRLPDRHPGRHARRRHDRRLGPPALRRARAAVQPDHQRGARRQPGRLRHHLQAARHHRVGVVGACSE